MKDVDDISCNHIILLFKKFLYANEDSPPKLNSVSLKNYIKTFERIEQKIASKKNKLELHFESGTAQNQYFRSLYILSY